MANVTSQEIVFYVAKVGLRDKQVRYISMNDYNGLFREQDQKDGMGIVDQTQAGKLMNFLNALYEAFEYDFHCYIVQDVENSTHVVTNLPEEYQAIVNDLYGESETSEEATDESTNA
ncbi:hypothetical protein [Abyssicoccus albus]|uniref:Uncharacterized protein n=1 Tax=Abyssicoccus albus TaxID=1817405 RepID=A0A3N5C8E7_9BACL|nr:hypothetical protein [Abyssicoccus albus]RPF54725.1 hypothetical protein EDD62_1685 [Abyssicoccus albus]